MANNEHLEILNRGVQRWNRWRTQNPNITPDLSGADLCRRDFENVTRDGDLMGINFSGTNLSNTKLRECYFFDSTFQDADLSKADLCDSQFVSCNFFGANLSEGMCGSTLFHHSVMSHCVLSESDLTGASFIGTTLNNADFFEASLDGTVFGENDLSLAKNLNKALHHGPSTLGVSCLYASRSPLPDEFLRGCGVPESLIAQIPSLVGAEVGLQFYSCFISYSSKDEAFARRLHGRMRDSQLRVWFAPEDVQGGRKLHEQIETAIRIYDKLLIVLSEASLQSEWVITELRKARKAERQTGARKLFPVRLVDFSVLQDWECFDADGGKDLAVELREYFIPDFSNWKDHDRFEEAFGRLLNDLKADSKKSANVHDTSHK